MESPNIQGTVPENDEEHKDGFGHKTISPFGSLTLLFNNLSGPGVVGLPLIFQQAGWLLPCITMAWISVTTWLASSMICEAMRYYPNNIGYSTRIEFATLCKFYSGKYLYYFILLVFIISLQSVNVSGIIETAQVMDLLVIAIFKRTGALQFYPQFCWVWSSDVDITFPANSYVLSLGFLITLAIIIPMGYFNLDDNMIVQKGAFFIACMIFLEWIVTFFVRFGTVGVNKVPMIGSDFATVFGTIMFNYAMVVTIPSWCNEKTHGTKVNSILAGSITFGTILFLFVGLLGAMSYKIDDGGDILSAIEAEDPTIISRAAVFLFPLSVVATSIPIYSIIVRYNLLENKICNKPIANIIAVVLPWVVVIPFYTGKGLTEVMNWSTLISNGIVNFIIPFYLFIKARQYKMNLNDSEREELDETLPYDKKDEDFIIRGRLIFKGAEPAPPHFTFGDYFDDFSTTPLIISATFVCSLTFAVVGVIIINILDVLNIH
uniref:Amino acid transporter transmembrane domain-containing protein n=1 Tax=Arcella intermedia TaxID=1963864 RepID=A0A6B2L2R7_9EUKA